MNIKHICLTILSIFSICYITVFTLHSIVKIDSWSRYCERDFDRRIDYLFPTHVVTCWLKGDM